MHKSTNEIVAFVENVPGLNLSLAICLFFRYCVFAKTEPKEERLCWINFR
jgi:hypothetical protein